MILEALAIVAPISYIRDNPGKGWNRELLSYNRGISIEDIDYLDKYGTCLVGRWDWLYLSRVLPMSDIRHNPDRPWDRIYLSRNKDITVDDVLYLVVPGNKGIWSRQDLGEYLPMQDMLSVPDRVGDITHNKDITLDIILTYDINIEAKQHLGAILPIQDIVNSILWYPGLDMIWDRYYISRNPGLTIEYIREIDKIGGIRVSYSWDWEIIAETIPISDIMTYVTSQRYISYGTLSIVVPISYVRDNPGKGWSRRWLSRNKSIRIRDIEYLDRHGTSITGKWDWEHLSRILPTGEIMANPRYPWSMFGISRNKGVTPDMITYMTEYLCPTDGIDSWNKVWLSMYCSLDDIVEDKHSGIVWDRLGLSSNPTLTIEHIREIDRMKGNRVCGRWNWLSIVKIVPIPDILAYAIP